MANETWPNTHAIFASGSVRAVWVCQCHPSTADLPASCNGSGARTQPQRSIGIGALGPVHHETMQGSPLQRIVRQRECHLLVFSGKRGGAHVDAALGQPARAAKIVAGRNAASRRIWRVVAAVVELGEDVG